MRFGATVTGSVRDILRAKVAAGETAAMATMRAESERVKGELRAQVLSNLKTSRGVANAWRSKVYPLGRKSLSPAGLIFTKIPEVIYAFDKGATIRPKGGKQYLAIPTGFNAARGFRGRGGNGMRVTPAQMVSSRVAFMVPFKNGGGFLWCLPAVQASGTKKGRQGRGRLQVIAGGIAQVGTGNRKGRDAFLRGLLKQGFIPMFLMLPQVTLRKRLDLQAVANASANRLAGSLLRAWDAALPSGR